MALNYLVYTYFVKRTVHEKSIDQENHRNMKTVIKNNKLEPNVIRLGLYILPWRHGGWVGLRLLYNQFIIH